MRACRLHKSKPYFNIVVPLYSKNISLNDEDDKNTDFPDFIKTFFMIDENIKEITKNYDKINSNRFKFRMNNDITENNKDNNIVSNRNIIKEVIFKDIYRNCIEIVDSNYRLKMLLEFVNKNKKVPMIRREIYNNIKIGVFWYEMRLGSRNQNLLEEALKNNILKADYDKYNNKEKNINKIKTTPYEKLKILLEFVNKNKKVPFIRNQEYKNIKIGVFWYEMRLGRRNQNLLEEALKNNILKADYDKYNNKEK
jgi:hypothetical protein